MEDKNSLRIKIKNKRKNMPTEEISARITEKIRHSKTYTDAKNVMIFYPKKFEINLLNLLSDNKKFYLPRVNGEDLVVCPYKNGDELKKSDFGVLEPITQNIDPSELDLVIVPALAVDKSHNRLGYGGGFYDRFLAKYGNNFKTIVGIPKEFFFDRIPTRRLDIKIYEVCVV